MSFAASWILPLPPKMSVFSVSDNNWLAFRTFDSTQSVTTTETNPKDLDAGPITDSSAIASVELQNWTRVFGWVASKSAQGVDENHLYMLSPVNQWIFKTTTSKINTSLAGISNTQTAWLYYSDTNNKIREQPYNGVGSGSASGNTINANVTLLQGTKIAACLTAEKERMIAYQPESGKLEVYNIAQNTSIAFPMAFPRAKTALALVAYKKGSDSIVDLFFLSQDPIPVLYRLRRVNGAKFNLSSPSINTIVNTASSLSALWSEQQQAVYLIYKGDDGSLVITQVPDDA